MRARTALLVFAALAMACLVALVGCGGNEGGGGGGGGGEGATVTGTILGAVGGSFVALGGQGVAIGAHAVTSQANTGRFTITGVTPGPFNVVVTPLPGFGQVLNPEVLAGNVAAGQTVDIGAVLLGQVPPNP